MKKDTVSNLVLFLTGTFFLIALMSVWGCATTSGSKFAGLTPNQSTSEEVLELLGEPEEIRSQEENNVWKYTFYNVYGEKAGPGNRKALKTEFIFDKDVMTDYKVSVVTKAMPEGPMMKPVNRGAGQSVPPGNASPPMGNGSRMSKGMNPRARHLLERFDVNRDGRITRKEYKGNPQIFNRMDLNDDQVIGPKELERL